jgi:hypothetical protein
MDCQGVVEDLGCLDLLVERHLCLLIWDLVTLAAFDS